MQFNFNFNLKKTSASKMHLVPMIALAWRKSYRAVLLIFLVAAFAFGWYFWQKNLFGNNWSEEKRQEFLNSQDAGVIFNQKNFEKALANIELSKSESAADAGSPRDIFKSY